MLPAGTPKAIVDKLYQEVVRIMALPDVKERIAEQGFNIILNSPQAFAAQIKEEVARWGKVIRDAKIEVQ